MSSLHLSEGSEQPAMDEGKLRLYSMEYCPYAHRARLILRAKNIPHDVVNINLIKKPEWYFKIHSEGKVPALDTGSKVVVESLDVANFLDAEYSDPPLYPAEPLACEADKDLIAKISPLTDVFAKCVLGLEKKTPEEWLEEFRPSLELFEGALKKRGTPFFFGDKPGMVDYMLWPWGERAGAVKIVLQESLPLKPEDFPLLMDWRKAMKLDPAVSGIYHGAEKFYKTVLIKMAGHEPDYDSI